MTDQNTCCGPHRGRMRIAQADLKRAASTIARAQHSGRKISPAMLKALEAGKRGVKFSEEIIIDHLAQLSETAA